jgi:hypothetical protein
VKSGNNRLPALQELGRRLHAAARRDMPVPAPRRGRGRRALVFAVAALLLVAGAAGAARLIAVGEPVEDRRDLPKDHAPVGAGRIVVQAPDPSGGLHWAARVYTSKAGQDCILAGQRRGSSLGITRGGVFRPFAGNTRGICGRLDRVRLFANAATFSLPAQRTLIFGRTRPGIRAVRVTGAGAPQSVRVAQEGAFLLVFEGSVAATAVRVQPE